MNNWETNPDWKKLAKPEVGDIVQLKLLDAFEYLVQAIATSVAEDKITGIIEAVFDWHSRGQITGGEKTDLLRKEISFSPRVVQNVIRKPIK